MNLYIFPEAASHHNGYGIGVDFAYKKLKPQKDDLVVWYTKEKDIPYLKSNDVVISKNISVFKRVKNVLRGRPSTELDVNDLLFLKEIFLKTRKKTHSNALMILTTKPLEENEKVKTGAKVSNSR